MPWLLAAMLAGLAAVRQPPPDAANRAAAEVLALEQKMEDDKAAFLKRVAAKEYLVHDLDSVKAEVHGDVVITYGRYVSLYVPGNRSANAGQLNSIWFERVYAKRDGQWKFLSHRTLHGPTVSPAGIDPPAARLRP